MDTEVANGLLIAQMLTGGWRHSPPPLHLCLDDLRRLAPLILQLGTAALVWRRIGSSDLGLSSPGFELRQAYRLSSLQSVLHVRAVVQNVALLRSAGVEPLLAKGWAVARLYPEAGLRPHGD